MDRLYIAVAVIAVIIFLLGYAAASWVNERRNLRREINELGQENQRMWNEIARLKERGWTPHGELPQSLEHKIGEIVAELNYAEFDHQTTGARLQQLRRSLFDLTKGKP